VLAECVRFKHARLVPLERERREAGVESLVREGCNIRSGRDLNVRFGQCRETVGK
jgi:hypothetical protein